MRAAPGADDDVTAWLIKHGYDGADIVAALRENLVETFGDLAFLAPSEHQMEKLGLAPGAIAEFWPLVAAMLDDEPQSEALAAAELESSSDDEDDPAAFVNKVAEAEEMDSLKRFSVSVSPGHRQVRPFRRTDSAKPLFHLPMKIAFMPDSIFFFAIALNVSTDSYTGPRDSF